MTIDTARLRALAEAATPGPWTAETWAHQFDEAITLGYVEANGDPIWDHSGGNTVASAPDAAYIAAADPRTILALLDEIERLRGEGEWEYGVEHGREVLPGHCDALEEAETYARAWSASATVVRRRKAGPWERVEGDGDA